MDTKGKSGVSQREVTRENRWVSLAERQDKLWSIIGLINSTMNIYISIWLWRPESYNHDHVDTHQALGLPKFQYTSNNSISQNLKMRIKKTFNKQFK